MTEKKSLRNEVFRYVKRKYKSEIEYLWARYPTYAIFRHEDNRKWFGLVMDIPREKLGLNGDGIVDVLNVKTGDVLFSDLLIQEEGFFPGYHISRGDWISILLDGTVTMKEIRDLIDRSFHVTASQKTKNALRPPKEWIIPSNPHYFDIVHAFDDTDVIAWKQGQGIKKGDTVVLCYTIHNKTLFRIGLHDLLSVKMEDHMLGSVCFFASLRQLVKEERNDKQSAADQDSYVKYHRQ